MENGIRWFASALVGAVGGAIITLSSQLNAAPGDIIYTERMTFEVPASNPTATGIRNAARTVSGGAVGALYIEWGVNDQGADVARIRIDALKSAAPDVYFDELEAGKNVRAKGRQP